MDDKAIIFESKRKQRPIKKGTLFNKANKRAFRTSFPHCNTDYSCFSLIKFEF